LTFDLGVGIVGGCEAAIYSSVLYLESLPSNLVIVNPCVANVGEKYPQSTLCCVTFLSEEI